VVRDDHIARFFRTDTDGNVPLFPLSVEKDKSEPGQWAYDGSPDEPVCHAPLVLTEGEFIQEPSCGT
jgi:hypothetical protein